MTIISLISSNVTFYADLKNVLFCLYDLSFHQYVHIITLEGPCLKAHISVTDCSILNFKKYSESANQSLLDLHNHF